MIALIVHHLAIGIGYGVMTFAGLATAVLVCYQLANWSYNRWIDIHRWREFRRWCRTTRPTHGGSDAEE